MKPITERRHLIVISQSEVNEFRTCRYRWHLRYVHGISTKARSQTARAGTLIHKSMDGLYRHIQSSDAKGGATLDSCIAAAVKPIVAFDRDAQLDPQIADVAESIMRRYVAKYALQDAERYEVIAVERAFTTMITPLVENIGADDLVLRDRRTGEIVLLETKSIDGDCTMLDARLDVDPQTPGYIDELARAFPDRKVGRVILNVIRRKEPSKPSINLLKKNEAVSEERYKSLLQLQGSGGEDGPRDPQGRVSTAQIDTLRSIYIEALRAQAERGVIITAEQTAFANTLPVTDDRWLTRHEWDYSEQEIARWRADTLADARLMRDTRAGRLRPSRNGAACFPQNARKCEMRTICVLDIKDPRAFALSDPESYEIADPSITARIARLLKSRDEEDEAPTT